ncbi:restriction endonuclease subunit S [Bradyrhizobium genomosp. I (2014)]|uniref:restriction endonuclease subunit S n=1 Tax=Bradyrhizobium genomosp. I (2014) TaxID=2683269 RepID=UPI0004B03471|nr:restriction endonuclease subunit S [Bradyrhizobium sp. CCBAU 43298]
MWTQIALGEILKERPPAEVVYGQTRIVEKVTFDDGRIHLRDGFDTKTGMILVQPGDLLVSGINAAKGAIAIHDQPELGPLGATIHYGAYQPDLEKVDVKFLWWMLRSRFFRDLLATYVPGGIKTELKSKRLLPIPVPLPSLKEQRRIRACIDDISEKIGEARNLRARSTEATRALIASELGAIFRGLAARYPVFPLSELTSHIVDGPHQTPSYLPDQSGVPFVTVKNMVSGTLSFEDLKYVSREDHIEFSRRCSAQRGDVLYSKDGATRGRPCYVDTDRQFSFFVSVALIKPLRDRLDGKYLVHLLNSSWIKDRMAAKSRGDMIPHIVLREIRAFPVPAPSLNEQKAITAKIDELSERIRSVVHLQSQAEDELEALLPAFLDKAFKGEL